MQHRLPLLHSRQRLRYKNKMENRERPYISSFVLHLLPDASEAEQLAAQMHVDNVIAVLYRICDRVVREKEEAVYDKTDVYATLDAQEKEP